MTSKVSVFIPPKHIKIDIHELVMKTAHLSSDVRTASCDRENKEMWSAQLLNKISYDLSRISNQLQVIYNHEG